MTESGMMCLQNVTARRTAMERFLKRHQDRIEGTLWVLIESFFAAACARSAIVRVWTSFSEVREFCTKTSLSLLRNCLPGSKPTPRLLLKSRGGRWSIANRQNGPSMICI